MLDKNNIFSPSIDIALPNIVLHSHCIGLVHILFNSKKVIKRIIINSFTESYLSEVEPFQSPLVSFLQTQAGSTNILLHTSQQSISHIENNFVQKENKLWLNKLPALLKNCIGSHPDNTGHNCKSADPFTSRTIDGCV